MGQFPFTFRVQVRGGALFKSYFSHPDFWEFGLGMAKLALVEDLSICFGDILGRILDTND